MNGGTYPGHVTQSFGGVGRNIADGLTRLGVDTLFISAIGNDSHRTAYEAHCSHMVS
jgi:pseudouridine-5'-phosphate glycosidase/pseudouridine kinase